jgi:hypothetical protein
VLVHNPPRRCQNGASGEASTPDSGAVMPTTIRTDER